MPSEEEVFVVMPMLAWEPRGFHVPTITDSPRKTVGRKVFSVEPLCIQEHEPLSCKVLSAP